MVETPPRDENAPKVDCSYFVHGQALDRLSHTGDADRVSVGQRASQLPLGPAEELPQRGPLRATSARVASLLVLVELAEVARRVRQHHSLDGAGFGGQ